MHVGVIKGATRLTARRAKLRASFVTKPFWTLFISFIAVSWHDSFTPLKRVNQAKIKCYARSNESLLLVVQWSCSDGASQLNLFTNTASPPFQTVDFLSIDFTQFVLRRTEVPLSHELQRLWIWLKKNFISKTSRFTDSQQETYRGSRKSVHSLRSAEDSHRMRSQLFALLPTLISCYQAACTNRNCKLWSVLFRTASWSEGSETKGRQEVPPSVYMLYLSCTLCHLLCEGATFCYSVHHFFRLFPSCWHVTP